MKILRIACGLVIACHAASPVVPTPVPVPAVVTVTPAPISEWPLTLTNAAKAAESGDYARADRILITHRHDHAGSPEAIEATLWRAIFAADPLNPRFQYSERLGLLDAAVTAGSRGPRGVHTTVLRRLMEATDSMSAVLGTVRANSEQRVRVCEEEVRKLTEELDRTTAELDARCTSDSRAAALDSSTGSTHTVPAPASCPLRVL